MTDDPVRQPDGPLEHQATAKRQKVRSDSQLFPDQARPPLSHHHQMQNLMNRSQSYQLQDSVGWSSEQQFQPNPSHMGHPNPNQNREYMFDLFPPNVQGAAFLQQPQAQPHLQQSMIPTTQPPYAPSPRQHPPLSHPPDRSLPSLSFGQNRNYNYDPRPVQYHQLPRCHCGHQCPPVPIPVLQLDQQGYYGSPQHPQQRHQPIFYPQPTAPGARHNPQDRHDGLARPGSHPPPPASVTRQNTPNDALFRLPPPPVLNQEVRDGPDVRDHSNTQTRTDAKVPTQTDVQTQPLTQPAQYNVGSEKEQNSEDGRQLRKKIGSNEKGQAVESVTKRSSSAAAALATGTLDSSKVQTNAKKPRSGKTRRVSEGKNEKRSTGLPEQDNPGMDAMPSGPASLPGPALGTTARQDVVNTNELEKDPKNLAPSLA
ncbi:hypothetical protein HD553DRAFT_342273 [Filobasidium floriforme]|uniref:uncharacterized protein n=1 Tax=Filobasidium floriforme TaxID=5210 RepID=UPI001E8D24B0|nr:uncharacterized protein HD553DRAFT_342273 [Filobasidium floriforme]KAH8084763.1 hypothetical protein HD553DRAFT_342273 [Filobasidium floriforme]